MLRQSRKMVRRIGNSVCAIRNRDYGEPPEIGAVHCDNSASDCRRPDVHLPLLEALKAAVWRGSLGGWNPRFFRKFASHRRSSSSSQAEADSNSQPKDSEAQALRRVEAILLVAREPLTSRKLAQLADLADATQARTLARKLNERYDLNGHAFRIEEVAVDIVC